MGNKDSEEWISVKDSAGIVVLSEINHDRKLMPELSNMGLRDAVYMLEKSGIKVKINGFGNEIQQSLEAGTPVGKNEVLLKLN
jgi:cell division protein FtsI (penicillin-binding protein 3)